MSLTVSNLIASTPWLSQSSFIVATGRSGSTLLRSLLDSHPELVVWPFEWAYFSAFAHVPSDRGGPYVVEDLVSHFEKTEFHQFDQYEADLGGRSYRLQALNRPAFFNALQRFQHERVDRRQFLQLVMYAYAEALEQPIAPKRFILTINQPCDALLSDFPDARIIAMVRDPLNTYVSTKRYYFKAADLRGIDRSAVYRPRAANGSFRFGLLETAISPIVFTYDWLARRGRSAPLQIVRLEDLQRDPAAVMGTVASFLEVGFDPILTRATICGEPHGSNMSSGESSDGRIVAQTDAELRQYAKDLTPYELWWVSQMLEPAYAVTGYPRDPEQAVPSAPPGWFAALKPLRHEFPARGALRRETAVKRCARWVAAMYSYVVNRVVLLSYSNEDVYKGWPYARRETGTLFAVLRAPNGGR